MENIIDGILPIALIILAIIIISRGIKIVSQADMMVVERLGKYNRVITGGLSFIIPIVDKVSNELTTKEQMIDIPSQKVITKDNVNISIDGIVFCVVENAKDATYNVINFKLAISNLAMTTLRSEIGSTELDATLSNRDALNVKLQTALGTAAALWGIKVTRVEISDISVPIEIERAMNMQMEAEREKRAIEIKAEADKSAQIRAAEGFKQEQVLKAEAIERMADASKYEQEQIAVGQQNAMNTINEAMSKNEKAAEFLLAKDRIAAFDKLAGSKSTNKMILPYDVTKTIGTMDVMGDAWFGKGAVNGNTDS